MSSKKRIIVLNDWEHVLHRPTMYIGSIEPTEERVPIVRAGKLENVYKIFSVGFYKLMNEILDNAFDEAKRLKGKMEKIEIYFDSKTSRVTVIDTGGGFLDGTKINPKTGLSNIETAMTQLRAGTNFFNEDGEEALIGTNGVGASLVNMLSSEFIIETVNKDTYFKKIWRNFEGVETVERPREKNEKTGTKISFIPRETATVNGKTIKLFKDCKWDKEYIHTLMIFRNFLKNEDEQIKDIEFNAYFDGEKLDLNVPFIPENHIAIKSKIGTVYVWESFPDSVSVSFINGAQCTGIHQKIINDWINEKFNYNLAHHFYETFINLNLPPKFIRFADQNKTKYALGRWEIEELLKKSFYKKIIKVFVNSALYKSIKKKIDERIFSDNVKILERKKKQSKAKISDKYFPPSSKKETLFIVEGNSAAGSILQKRNSKTDGVYTLKGKIKNAKKISDLAGNNEIIDLMNILGLKAGEQTSCNFEKIVIATDWDPDGIGHIASLLINLFYNWFPHIIKEKRLHILITPLVSADIPGTGRKYFYSLDEFNKFLSDTTVKPENIRYLKGLGSLSVNDWEFVMKERKMFIVYADKSAKKYMSIAFGDSSDKRKKWLQGIY